MTLLDDLREEAIEQDAWRDGHGELAADLLRKAVRKIEQLQQWVDDLTSGMYVNCVYCGHRYGPRENTPVAMADVLREHIEQCPEHPLSAAKKEIERLQAECKAYKQACKFARDKCVSRKAGNLSNPFAWLRQRDWDAFISMFEAAQAAKDLVDD